MSGLSVEELLTHLETDLTDPAIQRLIDDAEAEIEERVGELATQTDEFQGETLAQSIYLTRRADVITSVTEEVKSGSTWVSTVLAPDDYELHFSGRQLRRLSDGTNPAGTWGDAVIVVYEPKSDAARRLRITIDLVKVAVAFNALESEKVGDYSSKSVVYEATRTALINKLKSWGFA